MTSGVYFPNNLSIHLYSQVLAGSDLCDVIIEVANQRTIPCHAAVISCASDIVRELLELAQRDKNGKKVIHFSTACSDSMLCVLNYIYTGTETFNAVNVTQVLHTALLVGCKTLQALCLNFIELTRKSVLIQKAKMLAHGAKAMSETKELVNSAPSSPKSSDESTHSAMTKTSHVQVHSVLRIAQPVTPPTSTNSVSTLSSPDRCSTDLNDQAMGKMHVAHHHQQPPPPLPQCRPTGPYPFMGYQMRPLESKAKDVKKYCAECNRSFATVGSYTRHLRMIHYKLRPLNCDICGHAFYQRSDLKKHVQRQHQRTLTEQKKETVNQLSITA